ncbi:MAG: hypothetical protein HQM11_11830 [SAR324 cluster bacterium]|nr:hypothetical protein [SAR324 cluster bacterium]
MNRHSSMRISFLIISISALFLAGCSDNTEADAVLVVKPDTQILQGEEITLDASDSVYDEITWSVDGKPITDCKGKDICNGVLTDPGKFTVKIEVKINASGETWLGGTPNQKIMRLKKLLS